MNLKNLELISTPFPLEGLSSQDLESHSIIKKLSNRHMLKEGRRRAVADVELLVCVIKTWCFTL